MARDYKNEYRYLIEKIKALKLGNMFAKKVHNSHEITSISFYYNNHIQILATGMSIT